MNEVDRWMSSGAGVQEGLRLLCKYAPNRHIESLIRKAPGRFGYLLKEILAPHASSPQLQHQAERRKFREEWTFLSEPDCPAELKILAADKITAWRNYVDAHAELFNCTSPEECFEIAKKILENFLNNRKILSEFSNYRDHHKVLGKHPIFKESQKMAELRSLTLGDLIKKQKNLQNAIWRTEALLRKGDHPELSAQRESGVKEKRRMLADVKRMIEDYEDRRK